jgi:putative endonuclease
MYLVYVLKSYDNRYTYIGMTCDFYRRLRQHNQEIAGGAKYTKKSKKWIPVMIIDGFLTKREALQCEWRVKRKGRGIIGRLIYINYLLNNIVKWTKKSKNLNDQKLYIHIKNEYKYQIKYPKLYELYF